MRFDCFARADALVFLFPHISPFANRRPGKEDKETRGQREKAAGE